MDLNGIDFYLIFDLFLLLLIGVGPKIALVPFLELTQGMEADTQKAVANRMVQTAISTALLLVVLGWLLMRLLHFTPGAANIAGGIVLLLLALHMMVSPGKTDHHEKASDLREFKAEQTEPEPDISSVAYFHDLELEGSR